MEYLLYSVHFENAINKIDEILNSKELSLLQNNHSEKAQKEISIIFNKVEKSMLLVDVFRDDNIDVEDSEYKEEEVNVKIHNLISEIEDLNNVDDIIGMLKRRAKWYEKELQL